MGKICLGDVRNMAMKISCLLIFFYNWLDGQSKSIINSLSGDSLMKKTVEEAFALLKELASNYYNWSTERKLNKPSGVYKLDAFTSLVSKVDALLHK